MKQFFFEVRSYGLKIACKNLCINILYRILDAERIKIKYKKEKKMKLLFTLILFCAMVFSEQITIVFGANLREDHNAKSAVLRQNPVEKKYDVLEVFGDYLKVKVISNSVNVGKEGYLWEGNIVEQNDDIAIVKDAAINVEPKKGDHVCTVAKGGVVKIKSVVATWYKINLDGQDMWVSKINCK